MRLEASEESQVAAQHGHVGFFSPSDIELMTQGNTNLVSMSKQYSVIVIEPTCWCRF